MIRLLKHRLMVSSFWLVIVFWFAGYSLASESDEGRSGRPNIIIILADDLGYGDIGAYNQASQTFLQTPHIDKLAESGAQFNAGYVAAAVCSPSRAALMTGRYPQRYGYHFNDNSRQGLPLNEKTIAERLKEVGYRTGLVGKWQLGWSADQKPNQRGFDYFFGMRSGTIYIPPETDGVETWLPRGEGFAGNLSVFRAGTEIVIGQSLTNRSKSPLYRNDKEVLDSGYLTETLTSEAKRFIERNQDQPFFLYLAHYAPHAPLQATKKYLDSFADVEPLQRKIYLSMVKAVDDSVGTILTTVRDLGLAENTLTIFLSDNGCAKYLRGGCQNVPYSGGKRYHLEGGIRVPYVMHWPQTIPAARHDDMVSSLDILPTVMRASGIKEDLEDSLDGLDLMDYLAGTGNSMVREALFWRAGPNRAVRYDKWKLWKVNRTSKELASATPNGGLIKRLSSEGSPFGQETFLYDLSLDESERTNVADKFPSIVTKLERMLSEWDEQMQDPTVKSRRSTATFIEGSPVELIF